MIFTSSELRRTLAQMDDDFLTAELGGREYKIDTVRHMKTYGCDSLESHICIVLKEE